MRFRRIVQVMIVAIIAAMPSSAFADTASVPPLTRLGSLPPTLANTDLDRAPFRTARRLGDVDAILTKMLDARGYRQIHRYSVDGGIAIVAQLDLLGPRCRPFPLDLRFFVEPPRAFPAQNFFEGAAMLASSVFGETPDVSRMMVFIVSNRIANVVNARASLTWIRARKFVETPTATQYQENRLVFSDEHEIKFMAYEFEKFNGRPYLLRPAQCDASAHLKTIDW